MKSWSVDQGHLPPLSSKKSLTNMAPGWQWEKPRHREIKFPKCWSVREVRGELWAFSISKETNKPLRSPWVVWQTHKRDIAQPSRLVAAPCHPRVTAGPEDPSPAPSSPCVGAAARLGTPNHPGLLHRPGQPRSPGAEGRAPLTPASRKLDLQTYRWEHSCIWMIYPIHADLNGTN